MEQIKGKQKEGWWEVSKRSAKGLNSGVLEIMIKIYTSHCDIPGFEAKLTDYEGTLR